MKIIFFSSLFLFASFALSAQKLTTKNARVCFYASTPLEKIEACNNQVTSVLDISTGGYEFAMLIKSFVFKAALMQEHFNVNYMESDKYPRGEFKGKITNLAVIDFKKDGVYSANVSGNLTMHGVTKPIITKGTIEVKSGKVSAKAKFTVVPQDYNIVIPNVVKDKIAKNIEINVDASYVWMK